MFQCPHEDHSETPTERDGQETRLVSELNSRGNALELFVFLKFVCQQLFFRRVGLLLHLLCGFQDQVTVSFNPDTCVDRRVSVLHCQEANARPPMTTGPRLNITRILRTIRTVELVSEG